MNYLIAWLSYKRAIMAQKKKKPAANPARGFMTTSVASKKPIVVEDENEKEPEATKSATVPLKEADHKESKEVKEIHELTPEEFEARLELQDLQNFVEIQGPKTARESQRQISKLQTDCRVVRPASFDINTFRWLPEELLDEIISFARIEQSNISATPLPKDIREDDWTARFWTLMRTLIGLGISKVKVIDLLKRLQLKESSSDSNSYIWGLQESLERLAQEVNSAELPSYDLHRKIATAPEPFENSLSDASRPASAAPSGVVTPAKVVQPKKPGPLKPPDIQVVDVVEEFDVSDVDSDADVDEMMSVYMAAKARLFSIHPDLAVVETTNKKSKKPRQSAVTSDSPSVRKLQDKIRRIEGDILFDKDLAMQKWSIERMHLLREVEAARQPASQDGPNSDQEPVVPKKKPIMTPSESSDSDHGNDLGDMFAAPSDRKDLKAAHVDTGDASSVLRDFGKMAGINPRRLLEEACRARDSNVKINLQQISPTTYSCRYAVTITWSRTQDRIYEAAPTSIWLDQVGSRKDKTKIISTTISMTAIATPDIAQAEAFVSTAALFVLFSNSPREEKVHLKLGPAWRDLWQEFLDFRKDLKDTADRDTIKQLRNIVQESMRSEEDNGFVFTAALRSRELNNGTPKSSENKSNAHPAFEYPAWVYAQQMWHSRLMTAPYQIMLQTRVLLPMFLFREAALATIKSNQVTILCGETGCGKSTQLPAYIVEDCLAGGEECKVLCTEPRRISAISLAHRVSQELGESLNEVGTASSLVGYAVRLETKIGVLTRLIYATVGVVLRMLESSGDLSEYTHLIIDEVHERSIETDFLLVILKGIMIRRPELKVILMSATVDSARFSTYLNNAPIIEVPGRTFPVNTYYLEDAIELTHYAGNSQNQKSNHNEEDDESDHGASGISKELQGYSQMTRDVLAEYDEYRIDFQLIVSLMEAVVTKPELAPYSKAILVFLPGIGEIRELNDLLAGHPAFNGRIHPLHSSVSSEEQQAAFEIPPVGDMKIVLSTNIAETGVTIPDVTCVIDTGKHKEMRFDERRQLSRLVQAFISKANAKQRRGRAGRVQEGICFHLFTKKRHDELLAPQQTPEMLRLSLQDLAMRVKISGLGDIEETLGFALDPPSPKNIRRAIDQLIEVGALTSTEELTPLGRQLAKLPLDAHLGKLCLLSAVFGCLDAGLTICAMLSSKSPFLTPFGARQQADIARLAFTRGDSDLLTVYNAYCAWRRVSEKPNENVYAFCRKSFLSPQILGNIEDLKAQILQSMGDTRMLKQASVNLPKGRGHNKRGFVKIAPEFDENSTSDIVTSTVIAWAFYPKLLLRDGKGFRSVANSQPISLHPTSVNKGNVKINYLSYYSIMQSGNKFYNNTNATSTTIAYELPLVLLAGEADFKLHAGLVSLDSNRLKFKVKDWKTTYVLKMLRTRLTELVEHRIKYPERAVSPELMWWKAMFEKICATHEKDAEKK